MIYDGNNDGSKGREVWRDIMTHATGSSKSFELPTYNSIWKRRNENWVGRKLSYGMSVPFFFVEQEYKELMETLLENLTFFFRAHFHFASICMDILGDEDLGWWWESQGFHTIRLDFVPRSWQKVSFMRLFQPRAWMIGCNSFSGVSQTWCRCTSVVLWRWSECLWNVSTF